MLWPPPEQALLNRLCDYVSMVSIGSYNFRLHVYHGTVDIQVPFSIAAQAVVETTAPIPFPIRQADAALQLLDETIVSLQISAAGVLKAIFSNGLALIARGDRRYESYMLEIDGVSYFL